VSVSIPSAPMISPAPSRMALPQTRAQNLVPSLRTNWNSNCSLILRSRWRKVPSAAARLVSSMKSTIRRRKSSPGS
jgi:hypothetical protein